MRRAPLAAPDKVLPLSFPLPIPFEELHPHDLRSQCEQDAGPGIELHRQRPSGSFLDKLIMMSVSAGQR